MPLDKFGNEPGTKGFTYAGLTPQQKKQAAAIAISKAQKKHGVHKKPPPPKHKGNIPPQFNQSGGNPNPFVGIKK